MLTRQEEQAEREETMRNDLLVRQQQQQQREASTFHQHALSQADEINQGRYRATGVPTVTGSTAIPKYPQASAPFQRDPVPDEPPTGYLIDEMVPLEPLSLPSPAAPTGGDAIADAPSSADTLTSAGSSMMSERSASPPSRVRSALGHSRTFR